MDDTLNRLRVATLTYYLKVKFPISHDIGEISGDQVLVRECYQAVLALGENHTWMIDKPKLVHESSEVPQEVEVVPGDSSKVLKISSALSASKKMKIANFLRENQDIFT